MPSTRPSETKLRHLNVARESLAAHIVGRLAGLGVEVQTPR
ncbi:hypothetical protein ACFWP3_20975 [Streptomyces sp. NPDC058525]